MYLESCPITIKCNCQTVVCLSSCESELYSATECAQDLMYGYRFLTEIGLKVNLPMELSMDNRGAIDLVNNWSSGGRTRHIECRQYFLRELKENEPPIMVVKYKHTSEMECDVLNKNLPRGTFEKHIRHFVGEDEHMKPLNDNHVHWKPTKVHHDEQQGCQAFEEDARL